jgi:hypothetical protein
MKRVVNSQEASMLIHRARVSELKLNCRGKPKNGVAGAPSYGHRVLGAIMQKRYADLPTESRSWAKLLRTVRFPISVASVGEPWQFELHPMLSPSK